MSHSAAVDQFNASQEQLELTNTIEHILAEAKSNGATASAVSVSKVLGLSNTVRNQDIETLEFNQDFGFGITVYVGQQKGHASTSDTSEESIKRTVKAAVDIAKQTEADDCAGLADPELMATELPDLSLDHPMGITPGEAAEIALRAEQSMLDKGVQSDGVTFASHRSVHAYGNSHGFTGSYTSSRHLTSAVALAKDEQGMQRDYYYTISRDADGLAAPELVGAKAAERCLNRMGSRAVKTGSYPVLLSPEIAAGFWGHIISAIQGGKLYRKASFLVDQLGEDILPGFVSLYERPLLKRGLGSRSFDAEGVATREQHFVEAGKLSSYVLGSYSARKLGMTTTANAGGVHNLHVDNTGQDQEQLITAMGAGLLITEVMGQGVNLVTGDYSRGASGYWIENGKIIHPVEGITIASNLKTMMQAVQAIGTDVPGYLSTKTGSVLLKQMTVAAD
jgi:PmbA protein